MGSYVYRVTAESVECSDRMKARVAAYAYKPYGWGDPDNSKQHWKTGCAASDRAAAGGKGPARIAVHGRVYLNRNRVGTFYDDDLGGADFPRVEGVTCTPYPPGLLWDEVVRKGRTVYGDVGTVLAGDVKCCISALVSVQNNPLHGRVIVMTCNYVGKAIPNTHTLALSATDKARLQVHWEGFLNNCRTRAASMYNLIKEAS